MCCQHNTNSCCLYDLQPWWPKNAFSHEATLFHAHMLAPARSPHTHTMCVLVAAKNCFSMVASMRPMKAIGRKNVLGKAGSTVYAIALLASGQGSTITGTYAGQFIMQGFLDLKMKKWISNLFTRCIAIAPSLVVSIISGTSGAGRLIIIASMILSFELPFTLIPLLKFSSSKTKMGPHVNSIYIIIVSWLLGLMIFGINVYYLTTGFVDWLIHNSLPKVANVFIGLLVFPLMAIYVLLAIYLTFRKDRVVTFIDTTPKLQASAQTQMESDQFHQSNIDHGMDAVPYREDLADIPLPK